MASERVGPPPIVQERIYLFGIFVFAAATRANLREQLVNLKNGGTGSHSPRTIRETRWMVLGPSLATIRGVYDIYNFFISQRANLRSVHP